MNYNFSYEICGVFAVLLVIIVLVTQYDNSKKQNKMFFHLAFVALITTLADIVGAILINHYDSVPKWLNIIVNNYYAYMTSIVGCYALTYIFEALDIKYKFVVKISYIISDIYLALIIVNCFTGIIFDLANGPYIHGPIYYIIYIVPAFYLILFFLSIIINRKKFPNSNFWINIALAICPIVPTIVQLFLPNYLMTNFGLDVAILIMLFCIETPDFVKLKELEDNLEEEVKRKSAEILESKERIENFSYEVVEAFIKTIDAKDDYTKNHSSRVAEYSLAIGYALNFNESALRRLRYSALLHDIGKISVPDGVLQKPEKLTDDEFNIIKKHTIEGEKILREITVFNDASDVARHHHERYDGKGYPDKLEGEQISLFARIVCIADSYDAMTSKRVYKNQMTTQQAKKELLRCSGTQFDPELVKLFIKLIDSGEFE